MAINLVGAATRGIPGQAHPRQGGRRRGGTAGAQDDDRSPTQRNARAVACQNRKRTRASCLRNCGWTLRPRPSKRLERTSPTRRLSCWAESLGCFSNARQAMRKIRSCRAWWSTVRPEKHVRSGLPDAIGMGYGRTLHPHGHRSRGLW